MTDTPLEVKLISQGAQQAPVAVPDVRALLLALEKAHAGHMVGHDQSDQPKGGYSDGYVNGYGACIESARRWLSAATTPPAGQREIPAAVLGRAREIIDWMACRADICPKDMRRLERSSAELRALLSAAPTPPAQQPAAVSLLSEDVRELLEELQWQHRDYDDHYHKAAGYYCPDCGAPKEEGHRSICAFPKVLTYPVSAPPAQQPVASFWCEEGDCGIEQLAPLEDGALLYAAPPAQQSQWVEVSERLPDETEDDGAVVIEAYLKTGKKIVTSARYLRINKSDFSVWRLMPAAPGDTAAPEQAENGCSRCGATSAKACNENGCFALEAGGPQAPEQAEQLCTCFSDLQAKHCPRKCVGWHEGEPEQAEQEAVKVPRKLLERLARSHSHDDHWNAIDELRALLEGGEVALRRYTATPAAEQPDTARELISRLVTGLDWALNEIAIEPYEHCSGDNADAHRAAIDAVAEARALLEGGGV